MPSKEHLSELFDHYSQTTPATIPPVSKGNDKWSVFCIIRIHGTDKINLDPTAYQFGGMVWCIDGDMMGRIRADVVDWIPCDEARRICNEHYPDIADELLFKDNID